VYARAAAAAVGLDRFEERHWRELERQLGVGPPSLPEPASPPKATPGHHTGGGLGASDVPRGRRVIKSRWLS
ncbi:MAG: hypothetical protein ACRDD3_05210, partial [Azovibrio sp.]